MRISVILPAFNEEFAITQTLAALCENHAPDEVIVVDGGSTDRTMELAKKWTPHVLVGSKGRAQQMNEGARRATGDILLFLHADTELPADGLSQIRRVIEEGAEGGRFRMQFDENQFLLKIFETYTRFQCFSYGDQGIFVTRSRFEQLGGYREDVPFEDVDFYKRLRAKTKPVILKSKVTTSARRFTQVGCMKQKWINLFLIGLYGCGFNVFPMKEKLYTDVR